MYPVEEVEENRKLEEKKQAEGRRV